MVLGKIFKEVVSRDHFFFFYGSDLGDAGVCVVILVMVEWW